MSQLKTNSIANVAGTASTDVLNVINGSAKAWVSFNGSGTVAIRASYNVSSITDNGTGTYVCNFTSALDNANYSAVGSSSSNGTSAYGGTVNMNNGAALASVAPSTTSFSFLVTNQGGTLYDPFYVNIAVFR